MTTVMTSNEAYAILNQIQIQFKNIDGTGKYNFDINDDYIKLDSVPIQSAPDTPAIYIQNFRYPLKETDQSMFDSDGLTVEVFGFVKKEVDPVLEAAKLASDMEQALIADETLSGLVYDLALSFEGWGADSFGVVYLVITCKFAIEK